MEAHSGIVDFHNHVIPGVDDGAQTEDESAAALEAMRSDGVQILIATPHVEASAAAAGGVTAGRLNELDAGWSALERIARAVGMDARRGAEVRLDTPDPDLSEPRLRLDGGRFVLVEFSYFVVPPRSARVLERIAEQGWVPILAHPERYADIDPHFAVVDEWLAAGAYLQVNGPSLLGRYGAAIRGSASAMLERGVVAYLSSDYHARGAPRITDVEKLVGGVGAAAQAERLMRENPARLLRGELPLPVDPVCGLTAA